MTTARDPRWLSVNEFAKRAGVHRSVASRVLRAAHAGRQWRGVVLHVRELPGRGRGGLKLQVAEASLPDDLRSGDTTVSPQLDSTETERLRRKEDGLAKFAALPERKQRRARARFQILSLCAEFIRAHRLSQSRGEEVFVREYAQRRTGEPNTVREIVPQFDVRTLRRWKEKERDLGIVGLVDDYGKRRGQQKLEALPHVRDAIIGLLLEKPFTGYPQIHQFVRACFPDERLSLRTVQRFAATFKEQHRQAIAFVTNPDGFKNKHQLALGSQSAHVSAPNDEWVLDDTVSDLECADGRPYLMGLIDTYTRRVALLVTDNPNSESLGILLRRCLLDWGVPKVVRTDNGKVYISNRIAAALQTLETRHQLCKPFASEEKGVVECVFRTFQHDLIPMLPGFAGHNVAQRQQIRGRLSFAERFGNQDAAIGASLTVDQLQVFANDWCATIYEHRPHSGLPVNAQTGDHHSPFSLATSYRGAVRRIEDERTVDVLLAEPIVRSVGKKGIAIDREHYFCQEIIPYVGQEVHVRRDPTDLGAIVVHDIGNGQFVGVAHCLNRLGLSRQDFIAIKKEQKQHLRDKVSLWSAPRARIREDDPASVIMNKARENVSSLAAFPHRSVSHQTPGLTAASEAAAALAKKPARHTRRAAVEATAPVIEVEVLNGNALRIRLHRHLGRALHDFELRLIERDYPDGVAEDRLGELAGRLRALASSSTEHGPNVAKADGER